MVSLLLEFNANVDAVNDHGMSALCFAAAEGHIDVMKLLCRRNARVGVLICYQISARYTKDGMMRA